MADKADPASEQTRSPVGRPGMVFPQIARLELDELLTQLIDRAQDVLDTQGRLRALLSATSAVSEDLSLPHVLRRIVESACALIGARYGAIGVLGADGRLDQFIHTGMEAEVAERIGHLPTGGGILGMLTQDPRPLRLDDLGAHPGAVGFPASHPPMRSFLGVPVKVRDQIFGNIYLTEKDGGRSFTDDDEELLVTLAGAAAVAVDHAQLYAAAQARHRVLLAAAELAQLTADDTETAYSAVAQLARRVTEADLAAVVATDVSGRSRVVAADGGGASAVRGMVVRGGDPDDVVAEMRTHGADVAHHIALTISDSTGSPALLIVGRASTSDTFTSLGRESVELFADHVSTAIAQVKARRNARLVELFTQRDAIAQQVNDNVISDLFAAGLTLQGIASRLQDEDLRAQLVAETDHLDQIITTIRTSIFAAESPMPHD